MSLRAGLLVAAILAATLSAATAQSPHASFELYIDEVYNRGRGGQLTISVAFRDPLTRALNPTLNVFEGEQVTIRVVNRTQGPRAFEVMNVKGTLSPPIAAGSRTTVKFKAPARGNYIYHDPGQASLKEARTLFGDLIVSASSR